MTSVVVGVGVVLVDPATGKVLLGRRTSKHAPYWSIFGGHVDPGETFEACAVRELQEEIGITIRNPRVYGIHNNLETFRAEGKHTVSVFLVAEHDGREEPRNMEPEKCAELRWCDPRELPEPHFEASRHGIAMWMSGGFYVKNETDA